VSLKLFIHISSASRQLKIFYWPILDKAPQSATELRRVTVVNKIIVFLLQLQKYDSEHHVRNCITCAVSNGNRHRSTAGSR